MNDFDSESVFCMFIKYNIGPLNSVDMCVLFLQGNYHSTRVLTNVLPCNPIMNNYIKDNFIKIKLTVSIFFYD